MVAELVDALASGASILTDVRVQVPLSAPKCTSFFFGVHLAIKFAEVAKLVDAPDLGSGAARCESSSLSFRTIDLKQSNLL